MVNKFSFISFKIVKEYTLGFQNVAIGHISEVATLTGFSYEKMYTLLGVLPGQEKVAVIVT